MTGGAHGLRRRCRKPCGRPPVAHRLRLPCCVQGSTSHISMARALLQRACVEGGEGRAGQQIRDQMRPKLAKLSSMVAQEGLMLEFSDHMN